MFWDEILTHYYRIDDPKLRIVYTPGIPPSAANLHDYFNLIILVCLVSSYLILLLSYDFFDGFSQL